MLPYRNHNATLVAVVVAYVGSYNPHTKAVKLTRKSKIFIYWRTPSPRVVKLLVEESKTTRLGAKAGKKEDLLVTLVNLQNQPEEVKEETPATETEEVVEEKTTPEVEEKVEEVVEIPAEEIDSSRSRRIYT